MSGIQPVAVYAMRVPPGDIMVPAVPDFAAMFRVSMAAIDPSAVPEYDDDDDRKQPRSTLKLIRVPAELFDEDSEDSDFDDMEEDEDEESTDDDEVNGGLSDPKKSKKGASKRVKDALAENEAANGDSEEDEDEDEGDSEDEAAAKAALLKIMKGKEKANGDEDISDLDEEDSLEMEEVVVCTLDPEKVTNIHVCLTEY